MVYLSWYGKDDWTPGLPQLFYSPKTLGIPTVEVWSDGLPALNAEHLMWVLDPTRFYPLVYGKPWAPAWEAPGYRPMTAGASSWPNRVTFDRMTQIADYYVEQIYFYCSVCTGRSQNTITELRKEYSYELVVSVLVCFLLYFSTAYFCSR